MKKLVAFGMVALLAGMCGNAFAADNVNQTVTYQVTAINEISVSGNPSALIINSATAGSNPDDASDNSTTYAITTNESSKKITGAINTAMPSNTTLKVTLASSGGTSAGQVTLSASAQDLVTGISTLAESGNTITYVFSATAGAGVISSAQKTVTLTVADGA
jgi:hypothetical protein